MTSDITDPRALTIPTSRSRLGRLMGIQIVGVGSCVPDKCVKNEDLASLGCDADWIVQRTGILERRHVSDGEATGDLAIEAARQCIERAGVDPADIDLVLLGTYTPDLLLPATASLVQDQLGLNALAFDIQAACSSFVYALLTGAQFVASGSSQLALVIGADCNSRVVNPQDVRTYPLFGDGAGAVLVSAGTQDQGMLSYAVGSDGSGTNLLCRPVGGTRAPFSHDPSTNGQHFLRMDGRPIFKWAVRILEESVNDVLRSAGLTVDDVDLVIFHQANMRIISSAVKDLGIDETKVFNNVERFGNTSSGSIPLVLDEAVEQGRVGPGSRILLSGFGAGLAWGTMLLQW